MACCYAIYRVTLLNSQSKQHQRALKYLCEDLCTVKMMDNEGILQTNLQARDLIERVEEEYKPSNYGSVKYTKNEMYWIGYLYRYFSYTYELTSKRVYKIVKPKELREVFMPYHTFSPEQAIERILEAKGLQLNFEDDLH